MYISLRKKTNWRLSRTIQINRVLFKNVMMISLYIYLNKDCQLMCHFNVGDKKLSNIYQIAFN